jgi:hypothetical protein
VEQTFFGNKILVKVESEKRKREQLKKKKKVFNILVKREKKLTNVFYLVKNWFKLKKKLKSDFLD